jgi:hypothetical protein
MRVAVIVIGIAMVSSPSYASKSCMTLAEARQQFGQVHLWWHGSGHCWDARAGRHGYIHQAKRSDVRQAQRDDRDEDELDAAAAKPDVKPGAKPTEPKWREARDAMPDMLLPAYTPAFRSAAPGFRSAAAVLLPAAPTQEQGDVPLPEPNWLDRWVDIAQIFPRINVSNAAAPARPSPSTKFDPLVTPVRVILAFLAIALILAVIEILFRSTIHEYRK